jgi:hypothetical protein
MAKTVEQIIDEETMREQSHQATRRLHEYTGHLRDQTQNMVAHLETKNEYNPHEVTVALLPAVKECLEILNKALAATAEKLP